ncbi:MAG: hypothetical protein JWN12_406 [Candidatus Saccharibacteria bacterium]|nr:hypothetical protein [Candidatus Saccharibacteria bacterium]
MRLSRIAIIKLSSVVVFAFIVGISFFGTSTAHAEFECGTYGAGGGYGLDNYNSPNCDTTGGGTTTSPIDSTQPTTPENVTTQNTITLNDYSEYLSGAGKSLELIQGQILHFTFNGEQHTITIKVITDTYIIVTIASTPHDVTIQKGETVKYDVDGDGTTDISLSYISSTAGVGTLSFTQLAKQGSSPAPSGQNNWWILWTALGIVVIISVLVTLKIKARKKNTT